MTDKCNYLDRVEVGEPGGEVDESSLSLPRQRKIRDKIIKVETIAQNQHIIPAY